MTVETKIILDDFRNRAAKFATHDRDLPEWEARLACSMIERWGMAAAVEDGEDAAGRAKLRIMTPQELVERACEVAALSIEQFRARGWVQLAPSFADLEAYEKAEKDK